MKDNLVVKKSVFLESLEAVYSTASLDYLLAMRDGLSIIINQRIKGGYKPYSKYYPGVLSLGYVSTFYAGRKEYF